MHQDDECHSFLALAIRDPDGIVGVISLANKETVTSENSSTLSDDSVTATDNNIFTDNDERFVEAFAVFCGMAIRNAADYEVGFTFLLALLLTSSQNDGLRITKNRWLTILSKSISTMPMECLVGH
jgi:GAF domain-containing protein